MEGSQKGNESSNSTTSQNSANTPLCTFTQPLFADFSVFGEDDSIDGLPPPLAALPPRRKGYLTKKAPLVAAAAATPAAPATPPASQDANNASGEVRGDKSTTGCAPRSATPSSPPKSRGAANCVRTRKTANRTATGMARSVSAGKSQGRGGPQRRGRRLVESSSSSSTSSNRESSSASDDSDGGGDSSQKSVKSENTAASKLSAQPRRKKRRTAPPEDVGRRVDSNSVAVKRESMTSLPSSTGAVGDVKSSTKGNDFPVALPPIPHTAETDAGATRLSGGFKRLRAERNTILRSPNGLASSGPSATQMSTPVRGLAGSQTDNGPQMLDSQDDASAVGSSSGDRSSGCSDSLLKQETSSLPSRSNEVAATTTGYDEAASGAHSPSSGACSPPLQIGAALQRKESATPVLQMKRVVGIDAEKLDREQTSFSDRNAFHPHEIVIVPRSKERLHYAKVFKVSSDGQTLTVVLGSSESGAPLTKILPRVLVGKLPNLPLGKEDRPAVKAKSIILTLECLYEFMKSHPPVTTASFVATVGTEAAAGKVKREQPTSTGKTAAAKTAGGSMEKKAPLSPALYEHCLYLFAYHARRLYYCCKLFENQIKGLSSSGKQPGSDCQVNVLPLDHSAKSVEPDSAALQESREVLLQRVAQLQKDNERLLAENEKLRSVPCRSSESSVEAVDERLAAEHRAALRLKDEEMRKLQKRLRGQNRRRSERLEVLRDKIDEIFREELQEADATAIANCDE